MTPREAIDQAKERLNDSRDYTTYLNQHGRVKIAVLPPARYIYDADAVPSNEPGMFVTFVIAEGEIGKRVFAEFQGHQECVGKPQL